MTIRTTSRAAGKKTSMTASKKTPMVVRTRRGKVSYALKSKGSHILAAPKGPRTVSHRRIKEAVEKAFERRARADA